MGYAGITQTSLETDHLLFSITGIRSLNFLGQKTISIGTSCSSYGRCVMGLLIFVLGGGMGRLAFYDMCADKYRPIEKHSQQPYLTLGDGWIVRHYPHHRVSTVPN